MVQTIAKPSSTKFYDIPGQQAGVNLQEELAIALESARATTANVGHASTAAKVAWDIVEELWTAQARLKETPQLTSFEQYCQDYPDAPESRIYDV